MDNSSATIWACGFLEVNKMKYGPFKAIDNSMYMFLVLAVATCPAVRTQWTTPLLYNSLESQADMQLNAVCI